MIPRLLASVAFSSEWGRQMRLIAGPRQSGKTTLAKQFLKAQGDEAFYYNWDDRGLRNRFHRGEDFLKEDLLKAGRRGKCWVCYDEIHKMPKWKNILKAHFDAHEERVQLIVTGSARLDLFRRSGDSLAGRYFLFHLLPFNLFEVTRREKQTLDFSASASTWVDQRMATPRREAHEAFELLFRFGGLPEPFLKSEERFLRRWHEGYLDRLAREDLRDLTRIASLENVVALVSLLPARVGSPLSIETLRGDLEVSHETVQNYLQALRLCYVLFEVSLYSQRIQRSLRKPKKVYFHDWSLVAEEGPRFENYVAHELLSWITLWQDSGVGNFDLRYLRTREGKECDFLVVKDSKPWLLLEAKLQAEPASSQLYAFSRSLGGIPVVQVVRQKGVLRVGRLHDYTVSASRFFAA